MRMLAVLSNVILFAFTCLVLVTDGPPTDAAYMIFSTMLLLVPILTVLVILRKEDADGPDVRGVVLQRLAAVCNVLQLAASAWAIVDQYPHPEEQGVVAFTVVVVLTPILSVIVLLRTRPGKAVAAIG